jgi:hypothetical protein
MPSSYVTVDSGLAGTVMVENELGCSVEWAEVAREVEVDADVEEVEVEVKVKVEVEVEVEIEEEVEVRDETLVLESDQG